MWKLWAAPPSNVPFLAICNPEVLCSECKQFILSCMVYLKHFKESYYFKIKCIDCEVTRFEYKCYYLKSNEKI